jgi:hypothetical protein
VRSLALLLALLAPTAAASPLFADPAGDAGPVGGAYGDLVSADLAPTQDGAVLTLNLSALPDPLPPDLLWAATWNASGRDVAVGYAVILGPTGQRADGGVACATSATGAPTCEAVPAARAGRSFVVHVPATWMGNGSLHHVGGLVQHVPEATAWPTFVVVFTGADVVDAAHGDDARLDAPREEATSATTAQAASPTARATPGAGLALALVALAATGVARRKKRT